MLIGVLGGFLVRGTGDIKKAVDPRFDGVSALIPQLERLSSKGSIFVDYAINELKYKRHILGSTELRR